MHKLTGLSDSERLMDGLKSHKEEANWVSEEDLKHGATEFESFWLRPKNKVGKTVPLRLRLNKKISGWKLKDQLVSALGLQVGDTINTEVTVCLGPGIIDDDDDTDLFAAGEAADWLVDTVLNAGKVEGCVIDCYATFSYCKAPVGGVDGRSVYKASLILHRGIRFVEVVEDNDDNSSASLISSSLRSISRLLAEADS